VIDLIRMRQVILAFDRRLLLPIPTQNSIKSDVIVQSEFVPPQHLWRDNAKVRHLRGLLPPIVAMVSLSLNMFVLIVTGG